jgi:uncharacterized protein YegP (UPF0339 family)
MNRQSPRKDQGGKMQNPKFVIQSGDGGFRFHLTASNGEIVLVSQRYASVSGAEDGIASGR